MSASTVYDVRVNLSLSDRLTPAVKKQVTALSSLRKQARGANSALDQLAKAAVIGFGFKTAYNWLIKYNDEIDGLKRKLSTIIMLNTGGEWNRSFNMATDLTLKLREDAKQSAGTMQDMVTFAAAIANPVLAAGGNMEQLRDFTRQAVVAASALGERADLAQLDITQALQGTLNLKDRFARALLQPMGIGHLEFNKMSSKKRFDTLLAALNDPAIKAAAKTYATSFDGATSALKDNLQILAGDVGKPLFQAVTQEVIKINGWLTKNKAIVDDFAKSAGKFLVDAFNAARRAVELLVKHREIILAVAKAYLVGRGVSLAASPFRMLGGFMEAFSKMGGAATAAATGLGKLAAGLAALPAGLALVGGAAVLGTKVGQHDEALRNRARVLGGQGAGLNDPAGPLAQAIARQTGVSAQMQRSRALLLSARESGLVNTAGQVNEEELRKMAISAVGITNGQGQLQFAAQMRQALAQAQVAAAGIGIAEAKKQLFEASAPAGVVMAQSMQAAASRLGVSAFLNPTSMSDAGKQFAAFAFASQSVLEAAKQFGIMALDPLFGLFGMSLRAPIKTPKPPSPKVDKLIINVQADDPDRFYMGIEGYFQDWVRNPSQAPRTLREGR